MQESLKCCRVTGALSVFGISIFMMPLITGILTPVTLAWEGSGPLCYCEAENLPSVQLVLGVETHQTSANVVLKLDTFFLSWHSHKDFSWDLSEISVCVGNIKFRSWDCIVVSHRASDLQTSIIIKDWHLLAISYCEHYWWHQIKSQLI